jgi:hypothetical protein
VADCGAWQRGDIVRCAEDRTYSLDEVSAIIATDELGGVGAKTTVRASRIVFRTERLQACADSES